MPLSISLVCFRPKEATGRISIGHDCLWGYHICLPLELLLVKLATPDMLKSFLVLVSWLLDWWVIVKEFWSRQRRAETKKGLKCSELGLMRSLGCVQFLLWKCAEYLPDIEVLHPFHPHVFIVDA